MHPVTHPTPAFETKKIEILRTAARLIHRDGYEATRIDDIARAVKLSKPWRWLCRMAFSIEAVTPPQELPIPAD